MYLFARHGSLRRLPLVPLAQRPHHLPDQLLQVQLTESNRKYRLQKPFPGLEDVVEASLLHRRHPRVRVRSIALRLPVLRRLHGLQRLPHRTTQQPLLIPVIRRLDRYLRIPDRQRPCHPTNPHLARQLLRLVRQLIRLSLQIHRPLVPVPLHLHSRNGPMTLTRRLTMTTPLTYQWMTR